VVVLANNCGLGVASIVNVNPQWYFTRANKVTNLMPKQEFYLCR